MGFLGFYGDLLQAGWDMGGLDGLLVLLIFGVLPGLCFLGFGAMMLDERLRRFVS